MATALLHIWRSESLEQLFPPGHWLAIEVESGPHFLTEHTWEEEFREKES